MYLIAGLGNPGREYDNTRHNIGYAALDDLCRKTGISLTKTMFKGKYAKGVIGNEKVILLKPETYMNLSGQCVVRFLDYFKIETDNLIVIHDDIDFALGAVKIRARGSGGTHNGMKNIIECIGTSDFSRIRIGVGNNKLYELKDYVLSAFPASEAEIMRNAVSSAAEAAAEIVLHGVDSAMNKYNTKKAEETKPEE